MSSSPSLTDPGGPASPDVERPGIVASLMLGLLAAYRWTVRFRRPSCRFHPSCSTYATVSLRRHGALRGGVLALKRLGRCHPWNPGGVDHVPRT